MDIGSILIGVALLIVVIVFVVQPILEQRALREKQVTEAEALSAERESLLIALRDLDFDHATGKITTEDYTPQRAELVTRGVAILKQLDALGVSTTTVSAEDEIERAIAARRTRPVAGDAIEAAVAARRNGKAQAGPVCTQCGAALKPGDRFCGSCGAVITTQPAVTGPQCANCGEALTTDDRFCGHCGAKVAQAAGAGAAR